MKKFSSKASSRGSIKSEIFYFDDERNPVSRDRATWAVVRKLDENGNLLFEAEGFID